MNEAITASKCIFGRREPLFLYAPGSPGVKVARPVPLTPVGFGRYAIWAPRGDTPFGDSIWMRSNLGFLKGNSYIILCVWCFL